MANFAARLRVVLGDNNNNHSSVATWEVMDSETAATELSPDVSFVSMSKQSSDFEKKVLLEFDGLKRRFDDLSRMLFSLQAGIATSVDHLGRPSASVSFRNKF